MTKSPQVLRAAVIGTGYLGRFHAQKYAAMDDVELVGVVDVDTERAGESALECGTTAYADYRDLLGRVDAVSIAVPTPLHYQVARDFLEHDVDVLIEKPMTTSLAEADALIGVAGERGRIIQVGHLERFNPAVVSLDEVISQPLFIEAHRLAIYKPRCTDVSVVLDLMIHDLDLILGFASSDIRHIHAAGAAVASDHVDIANARVEFESGCVANITSSRISLKNERKIRLFQKDAYISVDFSSREITIVRLADGPSDSLIPGTDIRHLTFDQGDALDAEIRSFVHCVRVREQPAVSGQVGRDALAAAITVMDQIQKTASRISSR
ncbi:MAG: Gfo/Idh/MocA family oxidoreductase [Desulfatibacillaceae bacterium]